MHKTRNIVRQTFCMLFILLFLFSILKAQSTNPDYKSNFLFTNNCLKENKQSVVKEVHDGDTILIENKSNERRKIRLLGIDAFELEQAPYGKAAKEFLTMLVLGKNVCIETDIQKEDIYKRTLGYVFIGKKLVNEDILKNGQAILSDFPPNVKYIQRLKAAQIYGRQNMLGIWEKQNYIKETPSEWRHKHPFKGTKH